MANASKNIGKPQAIDLIYNEIMKVYNEKQGTKVKNISLLYDVTDGHDIDCKIDGFGAMKLKSSVVKKA